MKRFFGFGSSSESERTPLRAARRDDAPQFEAHQHLGEEANPMTVEEAARSTPADKARSGATVGSISGSVGSMTGFLSSSTSGSALGAVGSGLDVGIGLHRLHRDVDDDTNKRQLTGQIVSDTGNAITGGIKAGMASGSVAASTAAYAAAPFAMITGAADIVRGGHGAYHGYRRYRELRELRKGGTLSNPAHQGMARMAEQSQRDKTVSGIGNVAKGALGVAGAGLLLASNPVGWALLGAGAAVGAGIAAYKGIRKHYDGKKLMDPSHAHHQELRDSGMLATDEEINAMGWTDKLLNPTRAMRHMTITRRKVAARLKQDPGGVSPQILAMLGLKPNAGPREVAAALD